MNKTKIEWCDSTWNPVTGCRHGCEYCYARRIAERFGKKVPDFSGYPVSHSGVHMVDNKFDSNPYPFLFEPTFHAYRLDEPQRKTKPQTIFVCSMADLFGDWVPCEWIEEVFDACKKAPQHRYLFLTKNPGRYCDLQRAGLLPEDNNFWFGATFDHSNWTGKRISGRPVTFSINGKNVHDAGDFYFPEYPKKNRFVSFEPLLYDIGENIGSTGAHWHIIGAETGNRKGKSAVKKEWVEHIVEYSDHHGIPVFMKDSLLPIMGEENMRREWPWG